MIQKQCWKKPWAFILTLMLCVQLIPTGIGIGPEEVYAGTTSTWATYEQTTSAAIGIDYTTESGIITIHSPLGLAWLANVVNGSVGDHYKPFGDSVGASLSGITVTLTSDISLTTSPALLWKPIGWVDVNHGNIMYSFAGTFEGNNHTITGMNIYSGQFVYQNGVGLFGITSGSSIQNLVLTGASITSIDARKVGGLVGEMQNTTISNVAIHGSITGPYYVGGLFGQNNGGSTILSSHVEGNVNGSKQYVGGLGGDNYSYPTGSSISYSSFSGTVTGTESGTGGLLGNNYNSDISYSSTSGIVNGRDLVGGLIGNNNDGDVSNSYSTATVTASSYSGNSNAGGLIGKNEYNNNITTSYATGGVTGTGLAVGGLVGYQFGGSITNTYATGSVSSISSVGGLVGAASNATITSSYAVGVVSGSGSDLGGLLGKGTNTTPIGSFWDTESTKISAESSSYGAGKTTSEMKTATLFTDVGWDFATVWKMDTGTYGYPIFTWQAASEPAEDSDEDQPVTTSSSSRHYYRIIFQTNGGNEIGPVRIAINSTVTKPDTPEKTGYTFGGWYQDDELTLPYDFDEGVSRNTWLFAKWIPATAVTESETFIDLERHSWAAVSINHLQEIKVVTGITTNQYGPSLDIIRGDFMLMVSRAFHLTQGSENTKNEFMDVTTDKYYAEAIRVAMSNGIAKGIDDTHFAPQVTLTRQDAMALIYRTLQVKGKLLPVGTISDLATFQDYDQVSTYATEAVATLVKAGVIQGDGNGNLGPKEKITRAEMAIILEKAISL